ncbi:putative DNA metabolism protein [Flavobacterium sp. PL11]|uniref:TIGR03915 family putative DNA repair protein n=1 Tax=Flavobacterium sp. PL11 TaxID=3071717 RepID=UPI002E0448AB|nr:putative DNA metabolism protein [Flavobacterium sp. PL11]
MTLLSYDSTFEGFLTAVFEVFEFKYLAPQIVKSHVLQQNIFADRIEVITDVSKSDRVIKKLNNQLESDGVRNLIYAFLSEKPGVEDVMFDVISYAVANKNSNVMKDFSNDSVLQISQLTKSVGREKHRMEAFIRFELLKDGIYFAKIDPDFDVLTLIINHFKNRYQDQKWLIYDLRRKYGVFYDLKNIEIVSLDLDLKLIESKSTEVFSNEEIEYQKLWWEYFDHTNIKERKNIKLHVQHVPKRYWKYLTEKKIF